MIIISACGIHMKGLGALAGTCLIIPPVISAGLSCFAGGRVSSPGAVSVSRNNFTRRFDEPDKHVPPAPVPTPRAVQLNFELVWPRVGLSKDEVTPRSMTPL